MDRALNADAIRLALGDDINLPSPQELIRLLADAEVAMFTGAFEASPDLLRTAWYLHGIASSPQAVQLYSLERQRQAYAVSAHIFDLALASSALDRVQRLRLTFAAQIGYIRGQLDPNAIAAYRQRLGAPETVGLRTTPDTVGLEAGTAVLAGESRFLFQMIARATTERRTLETLTGTDLTLTIFGAVTSLLEAIRTLLDYLVLGNVQALAEARRLLRQAVDLEASRGDIDTRWVAALLLGWSDGLEGSSVWGVLPPTVSPAVRRAFTLAPPPVLSLWPPQSALVKGDERGRTFLDGSIKRVMLALPTSAGKTLLAQLLVATHLADAGTSVCFVAPTRSLCREVKASLQQRLRYMNVRGSVGISDEIFNLAAFLGPPKVEVMTPERLGFLLRQDAHGVVARFGLFVIDEVHFVGDSGRGWVLESSLSLLNELTRGGSQRIVVMSAAVGNRVHIQQWLDPDDAGVNFESTWRGPRRVNAVYTTERQLVEEQPKRGQRQARRVYDLTGKLELRAQADGRHHQLSLREPVGRQVTRHTDKSGWRVSREESTAFYKTLGPLAVALAAAGPILVISPTRIEASRLAAVLAAESNPTTDTAWLAQLCSSRLGAGHPLVAMVANGVAFHHASLPDEILVAIEQAFVDGQLRMLVSTTTLTEGVNLPVRTVLISAQGVYGADGYREFITGSRLLNAIGRAGRAARETEGWVVLARQQFTEEDFERLQVAPEDMQVKSSLTALDALAALDEVVRLRQEAVFAAARNAGSDFVGFVWLVASLLEEAGELNLESVERYIGSTLAWVQLDAAGRERVLAAARAALTTFEETDPDLRRRWARSGFSLGSSRALEEFVGELAAASRGLDLADPTVALNWFLEGNWLARLMQLPESPRVSIGQRRNGPALATPVSLAAILRDWVSGTEVTEIASRHLSAVPDEQYRLEELGDLVTDVFENYLPWVLGLAIEWTGAVVIDNDAAGTRIPEELPGLIRYGVSTTVALSLVRSGSIGRVTASEIAAAFAAEPDPTKSIRTWLCTLGVPEWQRRFHPSPLDLRGLLEYARPDEAQAVSDALEGKSVEFDLVAELQVTGVPVTLELTADGAMAVCGDSQIALRPEHVVEARGLLAIGLPLDTRLVPESPSRVSVSITLLTAPT